MISDKPRQYLSLLGRGVSFIMRVGSGGVGGEQQLEGLALSVMALCL